MANDSTAYSDWQDLCDTITRTDDFPLSGEERGLVYHLVATAPTAPLQDRQVQTLRELKARWERRSPPAKEGA